MKRTLANSSPVQPARGVPRRTELLLWVRAGGRCEFDGCNKYLFQHHVTLDTLKLGELAHVVAFKIQGPRGVGDRPEDIHDIGNLMLLCPECHTLIDAASGEEHFTRELLSIHKLAHEERIFHLTAAKPDRKTTVLQVLAKVGGQRVSIPRADIWDALAPMYPADDRGWQIDLSSLDDSSLGCSQAAIQEISHRIELLFSPSVLNDLPQRVSLFALAPMPLLIHLGRCLSNKVSLDLYQRHRDSQTWTWKTVGVLAQYLLRSVREGSDPNRVALLLSLSATIDPAQLPPEIDSSYTVYELTLDGQVPSALFLNTREDLTAFRVAYHEFLGKLAQKHGALERLKLFPAVPAPIAVLCGYELFSKVSPQLRVFDRDKRLGGWSYATSVG